MTTVHDQPRRSIHAPAGRSQEERARGIDAVTRNQIARVLELLGDDYPTVAITAPEQLESEKARLALAFRAGQRYVLDRLKAALTARQEQSDGWTDGRRGGADPAGPEA